MLSSAAALRKDTRTKPVSMTHQHFRKIAEIIRIMDDTQFRDEVMYHFAAELESTNPRFDRDRFLAACKEK